MAVHYDREHFIPIRCAELIEFLAEGLGSSETPIPLSSEEKNSLRVFSELVQTEFHRGFYQQLQQLKNVYAPFDPDADTLSLKTLTSDEKQKSLDELISEMKKLLEKANYKPLSRIEIMQVTEGASAWGLDMDVNWEVFDRLEVYYRGDTVGTRTRRSWKRLWIKEERVISQFNRLILILKQKPHRSLGSDADTSNVFLKLFKDMPKNDLEMVLPGSKVKLTKLDKGMIVYPLATGCGLIFYKILAELIGFRDIFSIGASVALSWSLAGAIAGYGYKSYNSYLVKKQEYTLQLTKSLYYQNVDSDAGVLHRLVDEAEEQESREVILAYFYLWKFAPQNGWSYQELDDFIEKDLEKRLKLKVDFEINDALKKLIDLGFVTVQSDNYRAIPISQANSILKNRLTSYVG